NLSSRADLVAAGDVLIAGFAIAGEGEQTVLIRGVGPALGALGVQHPLSEPRLTLFAGSVPIATNSGWNTADAERIRTAAARVGGFPLPEDGRDCALLATLQPGTYTAHLVAVNVDGGTGLIEVYDASANAGQALVNLSTIARL